ncbi:hybrid sensor histidine kinase/response regulator [Rubrivivax albus]|uniref:Virulence sensor protein BvgS n=1 Tax=Rubrivivax albus TaxID=2499835 RepID=A0A3S2TKJ4_9BURK|nr:ATP-binding protein [Rubrivivax albus]RVT49387.1 response regulator [Rubrivivax albus]
MDAASSPRQRIAAVRRDYNGWVARESMEDYALRFTPRAFRQWGPVRVAHTAFGGAAAFLILEAVGATLLVQYGFVNAALAVLATAAVIALAGWPISVYAARHGVDMDLLTRGAGFGYIGSTITSLIYASFTFIFFALEAAVMAYALELAFDIPPAWGYLICALVVIPLVTHGVTAISRLQAWTFPIWLVMLVVPLAAVFWHHPTLLADLSAYPGDGREAGGFDLLAFGAATTVGIALITQMGEQADYLRFMPEKDPARPWRWWAGVALGGPGWLLPGVLKMFGGMALAWLAISHMVPVDRAVDPNQMYLVAWELLLSPAGAVAATALFVVVSQLKINVTNAYAGSLAWSNFFSRLTHSHPGRVVWMVFNTAIALVLMEMNVFQALGHVLGLYANVAIAWMMAVVADLVVNKPLGWSPRGVEFRRAYLWDINPVGVGAMGVASVLSVAAHLGAFGPLAQAFSAAIAMVTAFVMAPLIAWATKGRYYLARPVIPLVPVRDPAAAEAGAYRRLTPAVTRCCICEREYEADDMAQCPAYQAPICSLCCTLDARCNDLCKPQARLSAQWLALLQRLLPRRWAPQLEAGLAHWLLLAGLGLPVLALLLGGAYQQGQRVLGDQAQALGPALWQGVLNVGLVLALLGGIVAWWLVLAHRSRLVAQEESQRQTEALQAEVERHRRTDAALQRAKAAAEAANQAKSRYVTAISHELRTPLNSILGYAQLLEEDPAMPAQRRQAVQVIRRGGDHLLGLIEGTLDLARIEAGKLALQVEPMRLREGLEEIARLMELQAAAKGVRFVRAFEGTVPEWVRADERRLRQILINLLGNAVKFTAQGEVTFRVRFAADMARFEIADTGPGMDADELARVFEPFQRGAAQGSTSMAGGTGLGLTISRMLAELMGGELTARSTPGVGSVFAVKLFLPEAPAPASLGSGPRQGYAGPRRRILVVDNEEADRTLMADLLQPLGFLIEGAASGDAALARLADTAQPPPDAIFMDLAMPGIDGWETIRRLRAAGHGGIPLAVVSANAFDRGLDHDVPLAADDFLVKPVRLTRLLDWLGARLGLAWTTAAAAAPPGDPSTEEALPDAAALQDLQRLIDQGWMRGIQRKLDQIEAADAAANRFVGRLRGLAQRFEMNALQAAVGRALDEHRSR